MCSGQCAWVFQPLGSGLVFHERASSHRCRSLNYLLSMPRLDIKRPTKVGLILFFFFPLAIYTDFLILTGLEYCITKLNNMYFKRIHSQGVILLPPCLVLTHTRFGPQRDPRHFCHPGTQPSCVRFIFLAFRRHFLFQSKAAHADAHTVCFRLAEAWPLDSGSRTEWFPRLAGAEVTTLRQMAVALRGAALACAPV